MQVAPGLYRTSLPLPFPPRQVNAWLIEDGEGWLLVDTGHGTEATRALWEGIFATALRGRPITRVLVTHFHPDHIGLAGWICARWKAPLLMPRSEWQRAWLLCMDDQQALVSQLVEFYRQAGSPQEHLDFLRARGMLYARTVSPLPRTFRVIGEGDVLQVGGREWRVMIGAGHAPEMACLWNAADRVLISADHVLPRITPNISVQPTEPEGDPLGVFLTALARFRVLPDSALVLPSHGEPFFGLHGRIDSLIAHHEERLALLLEAAGRAGGAGLTVYDALGPLFTRPLDHAALGFALSEALAHLHHLMARNQLMPILDAAGTLRFVKPVVD
jgi:glyoxylase-like metal-dependent hydrolase (beta-lactamase superfamily II)